MPDFFNSLLSKAIKGRRESRSPRHTPTRERMTNLGYALYAFFIFYVWKGRGKLFGMFEIPAKYYGSAYWHFFSPFIVEKTFSACLSPKLIHVYL